MGEPIALMLDQRNKSFELVVSPYYQSRMIVCGTRMNGEEIACRPEELYQIEGVESKVAFFEMVRDSFQEIVTVDARSTFNSVPFTILNGVCTLHLNSVKYKVQFTLEKGIKLNDDIRLSYDPFSDSYMVRTTNSIKRKDRYALRQPRGESYDRVLVCLREFGPMSTAEIASTIGVPENRISGRISEMCSCGLVRKSGDKIVEGRRQTVWTLSRKESRPAKMPKWNLD